MSFVQPQPKGTLLVGSSVPGVASMTPLPPGPNGTVPVYDSTTPTGFNYIIPSGGSVDPRDIMRFSMIHNVGVTGGG